jgi:hypothetical protein
VGAGARLRRARGVGTARGHEPRRRPRTPEPAAAGGDGPSCLDAGAGAARASSRRPEGCGGARALAALLDGNSGFAVDFPRQLPKPGWHWEQLEPEALQRDGLSTQMDCLSWPPGSGLLLSGLAREDTETVRIELAGQPPALVPTFGREKPVPWVAFVSPPCRQARGWTGWSPWTPPARRSAPARGPSRTTCCASASRPGKPREG